MSARNKVQLIGHLGADPEMKTLDQGTIITKMSIATNETYRNAKGDLVSDTQWHRVTAFGKSAEVAGKYLSKGKEVLIEGRISYSEYTDKEGRKAFSTDIIVNELLLIDKKENVQAM